MGIHGAGENQDGRFPAGHIPEQATLPFGSRVRLDAGGKTLSILEWPVSAAPEKP